MDLFTQFDDDKSGTIDYGEFSRLWSFLMPLEAVGPGGGDAVGAGAVPTQRSVRQQHTKGRQAFLL